MQRSYGIGRHWAGGDNPTQGINYLNLPFLYFEQSQSDRTCIAAVLYSSHLFRFRSSPLTSPVVYGYSGLSFPLCLYLTAYWFLSTGHYLSHNHGLTWSIDLSIAYNVYNICQKHIYVATCSSLKSLCSLTSLLYVWLTQKQVLMNPGQ